MNVRDAIERRLNAALESRAEWRRRALGVETDGQADLAEWFGLTAPAARALDFLVQSRGRFMKKDAVFEAAGVSPGTGRELLKAIEETLEPGALEAQQRRGVRLTERGLAECSLVPERLAA